MDTYEIMDKTSDEKLEFDVLTPEKIVQDMNDCIKEVSQVLVLPPKNTRILLDHVGWDKDKLMDQFFQETVSPFQSAEPVGCLILF